MMNKIKTSAHTGGEKKKSVYVESVYAGGCREEQERHGGVKREWEYGADDGLYQGGTEYGDAG